MSFKNVQYLFATAIKSIELWGYHVNSNENEIAYKAQKYFKEVLCLFVCLDR